jgi:NAD(P)-dependent dehydrogenase (short-subunit alcohol dehydrogenase family)
VQNYLEKLFKLQGKVAIVTGAAGQLGGLYVRTLLAAGLKVVALDIDLNNPRGQLKKIKGSRLLKLSADVTHKLSLQRALRAVLDRFGCIDILINNAALDVPPHRTSGPFEIFDEKLWDQTMAVNLKGVFLCCQVFGAAMARAQKGSIINISSIYGILSPDQRIYQYRKPAFFKPIDYSVSKAGILNLTRYLATYWSGKGVRVNTLTLAGVANAQDSRFLKNYTAKIPLGRMAESGDYRGAILFLASEASSYMTGANLVIDGGYSCW